MLVSAPDPGRCGLGMRLVKCMSTQSNLKCSVTIAPCTMGSRTIKGTDRVIYNTACLISHMQIFAYHPGNPVFPLKSW